MEPSELRKRVGGCKRLAESIGLRSHSAVLKWKRIPDKHIIAIESAFGIPREELRPDLYERKSEAA
ncbi:helix-turn-helix domain-containing protein [Acetobacter senegalensis]|uniref:YdaS family helix-turn-helix protein n=1 Tax=Acetobacter senegalensis TaxID=446692 RepID=UPI00209C82A4|nr:YdaS family helix-turn-helix protein [Acetobacter senegalensis]MCP1197008.1 helix-turn-helix domain-containing protein [Acetobacter senegalensis]